MNPRVKMRGFGGGAIAALTFTVAWLMIQNPTLQGRVDSGDQRISQLETKANTLQEQGTTFAENQKKLIAGLDEANRRLIAMGKAPVPVPSVTPSPAAPGLTAADVRLIVSQELADRNITITQAEVSQISRTVSTLQSQLPTQVKTAVTVAVAAYCAEDRCQPEPTPGPKGDKGDKGDPGKDAPKVTDEELLKAAQTALLAYCGQESQPCKGDKGDKGTDAPPPYSVVDTDCVGDGDQSFWRVYLSNGTDQKIDEARGPCRIGPEPN